MYKAVLNDNYLCHYNKNHSKTNGQFTSGDGDGDGISNDHANQREKKYRKIKGDISKGTWKNNAGVNLKFVSPRGLKQGYWIDADTGKKASAGNQWRQTPKEFRKREGGKAMAIAGIAVGAYIAAQAAYTVADCVSRSKNKEAAYDFTNEWWNKTPNYSTGFHNDYVRASRAKSAGGDW